MMMQNSIDTKYVIVLDAGSSGTRSFLYAINKDKDSALPRMLTTKSVSFKNTPGISSYYDFKKKKVNLEDLFEDNVENLLKQTLKELKVELEKDETIDVEHYIDSLEIPIYIQATAGMRLLPKKAQDEILNGICDNLYDKNDDWPFKVYADKCLDNQVAIIDGQLEGIYGWLSLNYQLGKLDENSSEGTTYGFLDMGGASQQLAFSPSTVSNNKKASYLKLGEDNQYDIFVKTWLGFGTNQARKRYLQQLIMLNLENNNDIEDDDFTNRIIYDNCLPVNAHQTFHFNDRDFDIKGLGNFENCERMIYPLLLKHIPCDDADDLEGECLFNGVTVPKIDFTKDRFVGISEYYYLTKDLFEMNDKPINFIDLEGKIKDFCESDYDDLKLKYSDLSEDLLVNSCFKLNWLTNILHEGFQFPRLGIDEIDSTNEYIPFMTMGDVNDMELSWTFGKALLYAASLDDNTVGYYPEFGEPILASLHSKPTKNKLNLNFNSDHLNGDNTSWHFIWFFFISLPFFAFKLLFFSVCIQLLINNLRRKNVFLTNTGSLMKVYNAQKHKNIFFKLVTKVSNFLNNTIIKSLNSFLESRWKSQYPYKEYPLRNIMMTNFAGISTTYDELELGNVKPNPGHSSRNLSQLDLATHISSQEQPFSDNNSIRATSSYSNLNSGDKRDHVLRTAFSLSDFKTYE